MRISDVKEKPRRRPLTPWELPSLLVPMHRYRQAKPKPRKDRPHYPAILSFVYRNRYAVCSQIQRRFSEQLPSDRTARRHLEEMEALGYLGVVPTRATGPLWPKVYFVTKRGLRKIRDALAAQGKTWTPSCIDGAGQRSAEGYSAEHVLHEVLVTEFLLMVWQTISQRADLELLKLERRSLYRHPVFRVGGSGAKGAALKPDAMFLFRQREKGMMCCFLEIDTGMMSRKQMAAKFQRYAEWQKVPDAQHFLVRLYRDRGATAASPAFRLLVVTSGRASESDDRRAQRLVALARRTPGIARRFWITTARELRVHQNDLTPLEACIWLNGQRMQGEQFKAPETSPWCSLFPAHLVIG